MLRDCDAMTRLPVDSAEGRHQVKGRLFGKRHVLFSTAARRMQWPQSQWEIHKARSQGPPAGPAERTSQRHCRALAPACAFKLQDARSTRMTICLPAHRAMSTEPVAAKTRLASSFPDHETADMRNSVRESYSRVVDICGPTQSVAVP